VTLLARGAIEVKGQMPWSSNATFLVTVCDDDDQIDAVYKPGRGERPLWDFPGGLYRRELAAYRVSEALGWHLVPETVVRPDAPLGEGSLQRFIAADFSAHYFTLLEHEEHHAALVRIAVFDMVINSADRKSGHCLIDNDGRIWAIDNGLSFHADPKLRTVVWDFAGQTVPAKLLAAVARLADDPPDLSGLVDTFEVDALVERALGIVEHPRLPEPTHRRAYPWPLV
jgi:uncharacterized repeat protein (TIGR03843 family)